MHEIPFILMFGSHRELFHSGPQSCIRVNDEGNFLYYCATKMQIFIIFLYILFYCYVILNDKI